MAKTVPKSHSLKFVLSLHSQYSERKLVVQTVEECWQLRLTLEEGQAFDFEGSVQTDRSCAFDGLFESRAKEVRVENFDETVGEETVATKKHDSMNTGSVLYYVRFADETLQHY